jgi:hypothetical protein
MTRNKRKPRDAAAEAIEYDLAFTSGFDPLALGAQAELTSDRLDGLMHPSGSVRVDFITRPAGPEGGPGFLLHSFQIDSMMEYLRSQAAIRLAIQGELVRDRATHGPKRRQRKDEDVWKDAEVLFLELRERSVPHPEGLARLKKSMPKLRIEDIIAHSDKPATRSSFTVVVKVEWDDEHWRRVGFSDGKLDGVIWD